MFNIRFVFSNGAFAAGDNAWFKKAINFWVPFFSESMQKDDGEEVSTREIKKILKDIIATENKKKPYTDEYLKKLLNDKGYNIARRTVAKYREQLNIPVARLRKELN